MRVIIIGASKIGHALAKQVCEEGYDLVVIDKIAEKIDAITDAFDCNGFVGNGASVSMLKKAGIDAASILVAVTKQDETNILCCQIAKKLGIKRTIAAVRGPEYSHDKDFLRHQEGIDLIINPDKTAAVEINKLIRYAGAVEIERFGDGNVNIATVEITPESILADTPMPQIQAKLGVPILICSIERGTKTITPKGKHKVLPGDKITFAALGDDMDKALSKLNILKKVIRKTLIVGGSKIGCYLAEILLNQGVKVTILEKNPDKCKALLDTFPKANIVCGSGTDIELMEREQKGTDSCVTVTGDDEENLIISMYCKSKGIERIAAEIDNANYEKMLSRSGINHIFSTQDVSMASMLRNLRSLASAEATADSNVIKWLYTFHSGKVEAAEFEIKEDFSLLGLPFKDPGFELKNGALIAVMIRNGVSMIPDGNSSLQTGDRIVVVSGEQPIRKLSDIIG